MATCASPPALTTGPKPIGNVAMMSARLAQSGSDHDEGLGTALRSKLGARDKWNSEGRCTKVT